LKHHTVAYPKLQQKKTKNKENFKSQQSFCIFSENKEALLSGENYSNQWIKMVTSPLWLQRYTDTSVNHDIFSNDTNIDI